MKNWQTTIAGLGAIAAAVVLLCKGHTTEGVGLIAVGVGLWRAEDVKR
jgi:hypothetical protein